MDPGTRRANMSTDGEVSVMNTPLRYAIRPQALLGCRAGPSSGAFMTLSASSMGSVHGSSRRCRLSEAVD